jgi:hypothetical protein
MLKKKHSSITITLLFLLFFVPFMAAWLAYSHGIFLSGRKVNHGTLLQPSFLITNLALIDHNGHTLKNPFRGRWAFLYLTDNPKDQLSQRNLYYMRQIRQATGKNRSRIERAVITLGQNDHFDNWLASNYPGTRHFTISSASIGHFKSTLPQKLALEKGSLYLVDPLGNIMMLYAPDALPKGILKDLERMLKVSQIG